jgi:hypothetical protein
VIKLKIVSFQVKIWFQNRRTKWKKQNPGLDVNSPPAVMSHSGSPGHPSGLSPPFGPQSHPPPGSVPTSVSGGQGYSLAGSMGLYANHHPSSLGNYLASAAALPFLLNANSAPSSVSLLGHPCFHHLSHS